MRKLLTAVGALVITVGAANAARAYSVVVGGLAGQCSSEAKLGATPDHAIGVCTAALARDLLNQRDRAGTFVNRGAMYLLSRDFEPAHADFQQAMRLQPDMGEAHVGEGGYLLTQERFAEAEAEISRGIELGTEQSEKAYYIRGVARWAQDDFKGAYLDFQKASQLRPGWELPRQQLTHFSVRRAG